MKKALISPIEIAHTGHRVAQVEPIGQEFEVAEPLYWLDCPDEVTAEHHYFDNADGTFKLIPEMETAFYDPTSMGENAILNRLLEQLK